MHRLYGNKNFPRVNTVKKLMTNYNNLKGERALEDEKQNIKGENSFLVRKKEIHKLKSSAYILWDFLRRGEEKSNQS